MFRDSSCSNGTYDKSQRLLSADMQVVMLNIVATMAVSSSANFPWAYNWSSFPTAWCVIVRRSIYRVFSEHISQCPRLSPSQSHPATAPLSRFTP